MRLKRTRAFLAVSIGTAAAVLMTASPAQAATITNLTTLLEDQSLYVYSAGLRIIFPPSFAIGTSTVPVGEAQVVSGAPVYLGCASLTNSTSSDQTLTSNSFSRSYTNTVATTVTTGVSSTSKVSGSFSLSKVVGFGLEESVTVSYQNSNTQSESITETHTAPSQNVFVPAGETRYVVSSLTQSTYTGELALNTSFGGGFTAYNPLLGGSLFPDHYNVYDVLSRAKDAGAELPAGFSLNSSTRLLDFKGSGTYTVKAGIHFRSEILETLPGDLTDSQCI